MRNFRELQIWKRSLTLVDNVYEQTNGMPKDERFGLTSQIRRSAVSIPSNIAEGCSRGTEKEFSRYLEISLGSSFELETQLLIACRRGMLEEKMVDPIFDELNQIQRMINSLRSKLRSQTKAN